MANPGPVLWVAQTEELCEQAVVRGRRTGVRMAFERLRVSRLWSGNEAAELILLIRSLLRPMRSWAS